MQTLTSDSPDTVEVKLTIAQLDLITDLLYKEKHNDLCNRINNESRKFRIINTNFCKELQKIGETVSYHGTLYKVIDNNQGTRTTLEKI